MSGILNNKTRILDIILTNEGKRQLAEGGLEGAFYSFTDSSAIYKRDTVVSGAFTETHRFILEAGESPYDQITFESDDSGMLTGFPISGSEKFSIVNGKIFSGSFDGKKIPITGSRFASTANKLLSSSIDAFKNQQILKSPDPLDDSPKKFILGSSRIDFKITKDRPFAESEMKNAHVEHVESFFQDKRLSHIPNFDFLPPVNRLRPGEEEYTPLGDYIDIRQQPILGMHDVKQELRKYSRMGFKEVVKFTETSEENNLIGQFFEVANGAVQKLDVIDFGVFDKEGIRVDEDEPDDGDEEGTMHIFFVGKVFIDDNDSQTFVHLFTLTFE